MTDTPETQRGPFWTVVLVASVAAVIIIAVMIVAVIVSELTATDTTEAFVVDEQVNDVVIETVGGEVTVEAATVGAIEVVRTSHYSIIEPDGTAEVDGATLTLTDGCSRSVLLIPNCTVDFHVKVPAETMVTVVGERTDVEITDIAGSIHIDTTAADIRIGRTSGPVTVEAEGSDFFGTELAGPGATVTTTEGEIALDFVDRPDVVAARTTVGPVTVTVPQAPYAVLVDAADGDIEITVADDPTAERRVSVTNSRGDVKILAKP